MCGTSDAQMIGEATVAFLAFVINVASGTGRPMNQGGCSAEDIEEVSGAARMHVNFLRGE